MKTRSGAKFRIAKWLGLTLVMVAVAMELVSAWVSAGVTVPRWKNAGIRLWPRSFVLFVPVDNVANAPPGFGRSLATQATWFDTDVRARERYEVFHWWFEHGDVPWYEYYRIPAWACGVVFAIPTALLWWRDSRRFAPGHCSKCGYDHSATPAGAKCPECGAGGASSPV